MKINSIFIICGAALALHVWLPRYDLIYSRKLVYSQDFTRLEIWLVNEESQVC
ncbi:hypothetical protein MHB81_24460 [Paenibacillus sp. FSL H7-0326]